MGSIPTIWNQVQLHFLYWYAHLPFNLRFIAFVADDGLAIVLLRLRASLWLYLDLHETLCTLILSSGIP
jgi:hypothetical protein